MEIEKDLKQTAQEVMAKKGTLMGGGFISVFSFILQEKGSEGIKAVEDGIENLGYSLKYENIEIKKSYPNGFLVLIFLLSKQLFGWTNEDIFRMGICAPRLSPINKMLLKHHFLSVKNLSQKGLAHWRSYYDVGKLWASELNEKEEYMIIKLTGFDFHPVYCFFLKGYIKGLIEFTVKSVSVEEVKCIYRGDDYHEYRAIWK